MKSLDRIKQNRTASFLVVLLVYVIAGAVGIFTYRALNYEWWLNLLIADVVATVVTFFFSVLFDNASVYDPYWSVQPIVILAAYAADAKLTLGRVLLLVAVCIWGVRLTVNWGYTFYGLKHQDWRYTMLSEKTGAFYPLINFLGIHLVPTLIVYGCVFPAAYAFVYDGMWSAWCAVFFCLSVGAAVLQGTADLQMHRFRRQKTGGFIRAGLWKYSRHPNYLGEILMWWSIALFAVAMFPGEWKLCIGAIANNLLFLVVSIPMADKRQSAKPGFEEYANETRKLLPIKR